MSTAKTAAKKSAELALKASKIKLKKPKGSIYTESERKERSSLSSKKSYYNRQIKKLNMVSSDGTITFKDLREFMDDDGSDSLAAELAQAGYFGPDNYDIGDFREHIRNNPNEDDPEETIKAILNNTNANRTDPESYINYDTGLSNKQEKQLAGYKQKVKDIDAQMAKIEGTAQGRRDAEMAKYLNKKSMIETGEGILEAIQKGEVVYSALSKPEQSAIKYLKKGFLEAIKSTIDFESIDEAYRPIIKQAIYTGVMSNPLEGIKSGLIGSAALKVAEKYGNDAGDFAAGIAESMSSMITGGAPNIKGIAQAALNFGISKSSFSKPLMLEIAEDVAFSGDAAAYDDQNGKILARDVAVDVVKDVISTGGNFLAALPLIAKDVLLDAGQAGIRQLKYDAKKDKTKADVKKQEEEAKKAQQAFKASGEEVDVEELLKKYMQ